MSNKTKVSLLCLAIGLPVLFGLAALLLKPSPLNENSARTYALDYIKSTPELILKEEEADIKDVTIQKRNLHGQLLSIAKVNVGLRGDSRIWATLYMVSSPDNSTIVTGDSEYIFNEVDRDGYAQVYQRIDARQSAQTSTPKQTPTPTSTVIYREYPAPTRAP